MYLCNTHFIHIVLPRNITIIMRHVIFMITKMGVTYQITHPKICTAK